MADFNTIAETRPLPLPGFIEYTERRISTALYVRKGKPQIATSTLTPGFDGSRDLGIIWGPNNIAYGQDNVNTAAWLAAMNAALVGIAVVTENANVVTLTTVKNEALALGVFDPDAPDLDLSAWLIDPSGVAVSSSVIMPGMGVVWKNRATKQVQAPLPDSTLDDFVGVVDRMSVSADDLAIKWAGAADTFWDAQAMLVHRFGSFYLRGQGAVPVVDGAPVWMGRIPAESGYFYGANDVGNTRLQITGSTFMGGGTPSAERGLRAYFSGI